MKTIVKNGMLCTESGVYEADILIENGVIREIGTGLAEHESKLGSADAEIEIVDASGKYVLPGAVDIHTHMDLDVGIARVIDDFYTGTIAAACGGTTSIVDHMAFGPKDCSLWHQVREYHKLADGNAVVDYGFHGVFQHVNPQVLEEMGEIAKKAAAMEGADFLCLRLAGGDPNGLNKSVEELIETVKEVADAVDVPLVVEGCKNVEKDSELLTKVAEVLQGRNVLVMSAREEDYKAVGAAAGLAYNQKVGAESAVDINLAKQLNVVMTQLGVSADSIVMNVGSAAVGYGYEYVVSTLDRIKAAALSQDDKMLQMPIITPIASETWNVKEAMATEEESPEWGNQEVRGVSMEIQTAAASLASGSDAVILKHPQSVATISKMIQELM